MIIIGEKLNGSIPSVGKAIAERNEKRIRSLAAKQEEAGADYLDVCASVPEDVEDLQATCRKSREQMLPAAVKKWSGYSLRSL